VEGEVDWAVPQTRPGHTAKVSHNLPETTKSVGLSLFDQVELLILFLKVSREIKRDNDERRFASFIP
jgi:hypothetical protein